MKRRGSKRPGSKGDGWLGQFLSLIWYRPRAWLGQDEEEVKRRARILAEETQAQARRKEQDRLRASRLMEDQARFEQADQQEAELGQSAPKRSIWLEAQQRGRKIAEQAEVEAEAEAERLAQGLPQRQTPTQGQGQGMG